jgi:raffinose/stachyose/melibiose transport system substrate-binding protein
MRYKISLYVSVLIVLVSALSFAPALSQDAPVTLDFFFLGDEITNPFVEEIIAAFEADNPNIAINFQSYPNEAYKTAIQVSLGSDDAPDILFNWNGEDTGRFVREGHLLDLTPYAESFGWYDAINPAALDAFTFNGVLYGVPYSLEAKYYYYNTTIFEQQSLTVPQTFDELLQVCGTLRDAGITPMSFGNQERWEGVHYMTIFNQKVVGEETILADYSLDVSPDTLFTDPGYAIAFQRLLDMQNAGCFADAVNATTPDAALAQFLVQQVAMYYQGTWIMGNLSANDFANYGMFRMPPMTDDAAQGNQNYALLGPISLQVSSSTEAPDAAAAFLNYFISQPVQQRFVEMTNRIPVRADALTDEIGTPELRNVVSDLATTEGAVAWLDVVLENSVSEAYLNAIQEVLAGTLTPTQAMENIRTVALDAQQSLGLGGS